MHDLTSPVKQTNLFGRLLCAGNPKISASNKQCEVLPQSPEVSRNPGYPQISATILATPYSRFRACVAFSLKSATNNKTMARVMSGADGIGLMGRIGKLRRTCRGMVTT